MSIPRRRAALVAPLVIALAQGLRPAAALAQQDPSPVRVTQIKPRLYLIADSIDNLIVYAGKEASLVGGVQSPPLVARARTLLKSLNAPPVRHVVMMESEGAPHYGDGGWRKDGAMTFVHEALWARLWDTTHPSKDSLADGTPIPSSVVASGADLPLVGFSQVIMLYFGSGVEEEVHFIHERSGYTDSDLIGHFERSGVLYLGNAFTTDGYPLIDLQRRGRIAGVIATAEYFLTNFAERPEKVSVIVPGRGRPGTLADLRQYRDMLVTIRDSVQVLLQAGQTVDQVVGAKVSAALDARWGHGPVTPDQFVASVYKTLPRPKKPADQR
jgi:hypothetical protein